MSDHALIATTHSALWLFTRLPDDHLVILLHRIPAATFAAWQPLRIAVAPGQTSLAAAAEYLAAVSVASTSLTLLNYRYNLPLLDDPPSPVATLQCEEPIAGEIDSAALQADWHGDATPDGAPFAHCRWFRALDALPLLRYAEHVETLMLLWQRWTPTTPRMT